MTITHKSWFGVAFQVRGSVIPTVFPFVLVYAVWGILVSLFHEFGLPLLPVFSSLIPNVIFNLILGLLLVFRTNTAYERFWEGRIVWGTVVISIRNLARHIQVGVTAPEVIDQEKKAAVLRLLGAFAIATKLHLRKEPLDSQLEALLTPAQVLRLKTVKNAPLEITFLISDYLQQQQQRNCLSIEHLTAINTLLDKLVEALTGCERILNTPMPLAYAIHLKQLILFYCASLPFQLVKDLNWWTGLAVALVSFTLLGIEAIGIEIENPFGQDDNDLPLDEICNNILQNIEDFNQPDALTIDVLERAVN